MRSKNGVKDTIRFMMHMSFEFCPIHTKATIDAVCKNPSNALFPMINYNDEKKNSVSKLINDLLTDMEEKWNNDRSIDKPLEYTTGLRTHSTRVTTIGILNDVHQMNERWSDNRAGLSKMRSDTTQTYFRGSTRSDTACALALSGWPNPTATNGTIIVNFCLILYKCLILYICLISYFLSHLGILSFTI